MSKATPARLIIVVLYKTDVAAAPTLQALSGCNAVLHPADKIFIWDNSPQPQDTPALSELQAALITQLEYRHTPQNISLAKIYNTVIAEYPDAGLLFLFDQDSAFGPGYFEAIDKASAEHPEVNLFLPLIKAGTQVVSPGHFQYFKGRYWRTARYGLVPARNNVAIASGMCIRMRYLRTFGGFEEKLQLYGIDTNFMIRYGRDNEHFFVVSAPFTHDLSGFSEEARDRKKARFADFKKASVVNSKLFSRPVQILSRLFLWYKSVWG